MLIPRRWLLACLLLVPLTTGCAGSHHRVCALVEPPVCDACQLARCHVHIFLLNGNNPFDTGGLGDVCDECQRLGFRQTYFGYGWHAGWMQRELCRVHKDDPSAHFVFIGHGGGVETLRALARSAAEAGAAVDMLLVLDAGDTVLLADGAVPERPLFVGNDAELEAQLMSELTEVAHHVPVEHRAAKLPEYGPVPRQVPPEPLASSGPDWDSLHPVADLPAPPR